MNYRGQVGVTQLGKTCLRWADVEGYTPQDYPDAGLEVCTRSLSNKAKVNDFN